MDTNKLTQKSAEAIRSAQELAIQYGNPQIEQSHLLCALVFQEDGLIPQLMTRMGMTVESFRAAVGAEVEKLPKVVNNLLCGGMHSLHPVGDVRIIKAEEVAEEFHARFGSKGKKYRYIIRNTAEPDIFRRNYCYQVLQPLDTESMAEAAKHIVGTHDFKCFQAAGGDGSGD